MPLRAPCTTCNRHLREGAVECPFCKAVVRASPGPRRLSHAVLALAASTLVAPSAFAQVGDAAAPDAAAADAGPSEAELEAERAARQVYPLYGTPPPPHTCGCGVTGEGEDATSHALGAAVLVGAVVLARSRKKHEPGA